MRFDIADVQGLIDSGNWEEVIKHEMAHVIGIGTVWKLSGFLNNPCGFFSFFGCNPTYNRPEGIVGHEALGGSGPVPVANTGGLGTLDGHWREETFGNELLTGYLNSGMENPVSIMTIRSLKDMGYEVDMTSAESYEIPDYPLRAEYHLSLGDDILNIEPIDMQDVLASMTMKEAPVDHNTTLAVIIVVAAAVASMLSVLFTLYIFRNKETDDSEEQDKEDVVL